MTKESGNPHFESGFPEKLGFDLFVSAAPGKACHANQADAEQRHGGRIRSGLKTGLQGRGFKEGLFGKCRDKTRKFFPEIRKNLSED